VGSVTPFSGGKAGLKHAGRREKGKRPSKETCVCRVF